MANTFCKWKLTRAGHRYREVIREVDGSKYYEVDTYNENKGLLYINEDEVIDEMVTFQEIDKHFDHNNNLSSDEYDNCIDELSEKLISKVDVKMIKDQYFKKSKSKMKKTNYNPCEWCYECPYCGESQGWTNYIDYDDDEFFDEVHTCDKCNKEFKINK